MAGENEGVVIDQDDLDMEAAYDEIGDEIFDDGLQEADQIIDTGALEQEEEKLETTVIPEGDDTVDDKLTEKELQQERSWEGRLNKREEALQKREEALAAQPALEVKDTEKLEEEELDPNLMNEEELVAFEAEYPDVQRYADTVLSRKSGETEERIAAVEQTVAPIIQTTKDDVLATHFKTLGDAHPDFKTVANSDDMQAFIDQSPAYAREGMRAVLTKGSAQDCVELLDDYKHARGIEIVPAAEDPGQEEEIASAPARRIAPRQRGRTREEGRIRPGSRNLTPARRANSGDFGSIYDSIDDDSID